MLCLRYSRYVPGNVVSIAVANEALVASCLNSGGCKIHLFGFMKSSIRLEQQ